MKLYLTQDGISAFRHPETPIIATFDCDNDNAHELMNMFYTVVNYETITPVLTHQENSEKSAAREADIDDLKSQIDMLERKIKSLEVENEVVERTFANLNNRLTSVYGFISEIMKRLALITIIPATHRQKNAKIAEYVRNLDTLLRIIDSPPQDMDDIPKKKRWDEPQDMDDIPF